MSRSRSASSSSESYYSYSEESKPDSFLKSRCSKQAYTNYDTVKSVPTEEEAAEYLEQLAFEEEEEQIYFLTRPKWTKVLKCFFI